MLPAFFRPSRVLSCLSVVSVGLAMASFFGAVVGAVVGIGVMVPAMALPTLAVGVAWAALLRWPRTVGRTRLRWGWPLSVPLAALDAALGGVVMVVLEGDSDAWLAGAIGGVFTGVILWVPAMLAVLVLFGAPIAWSQRQARRGLPGAERGETAVGAVCALLSLVGLLALVSAREKEVVTDTVSGQTSVQATLPLLRRERHDVMAGAVLAVLGLLTGGATTTLATSRARRRRALIEAAESGARADFRVEHTDAGRVLIRVRPADDHRQAAGEESFALEEIAQPVPGISARSPGDVSTTGA